jgi:hypothetical protein
MTAELASANDCFDEAPHNHGELDIENWEKNSWKLFPTPCFAYYKSSPAFLNPHLCQFLVLEHSASPFKVMHISHTQHFLYY